MKGLVFFFITLGLAMSFPQHVYDLPMFDPQQRDPVEDPGPMRDPQERDPVWMPPALPHARDPQERDPVDPEDQMTGKDKRGYGHGGYGGYRGGYRYGYGGRHGKYGYYGK